MNIKRKTQMMMARYGIDFSGQAFSYGNMKIPANHLIINTGSSLQCPSKILELCKIKRCYAQKLEKLRPAYRNKNEAVGLFFKRASLDDLIELIEAYVNDAFVEITHFRFMEACDFHSQIEISRINRICDYFKERYGFISYAWSARSDLDFSKRSFYLNASNISMKDADRYFLAVHKNEYEKIQAGDGIRKCPGGRMSCKKCHLCYNDKFHGTIYCKIH